MPSSSITNFFQIALHKVGTIMIMISTWLGIAHDGMNEIFDQTSCKVRSCFLTSCMGKTTHTKFIFQLLWMVNAYQLYDPCSNSADCASQTPDPQRKFLWEDLEYPSPVINRLRLLLVAEKISGISLVPCGHWWCDFLAHPNQTVSGILLQYLPRAVLKVTETIDTESVGCNVPLKPFFEDEELVDIDWINRAAFKLYKAILDPHKKFRTETNSGEHRIYIRMGKWSNLNRMFKRGCNVYHQR